MRSLNFFFVIVVFLFSFSLFSLAEEISRTATVLALEGSASIKTGPDSDWLSLAEGDIVSEKSVLRTNSNSKVKLLLNGEVETAIVWIKPNSQLFLSTLTENPEETRQNTLLDLAIGEILIKAQKLHAQDSKFEVKTPTSIVGVRGTTFAVTVQAEE